MSKPTYIIAGILAVALSFVANLWTGYPVAQSPSAASSAPPPTTSSASQETSINDLPKTETSGFQWNGLVHLNVQPDTGAPVVTGQPILRLMPTSDNGFHALAGQFSGLNKNQVYRFTIWVKPIGGANIEIDMDDHPGGNPVNFGTVVFDLTGRAIQTDGGATKDRGIELAPSGWQKAWLDLATSDGQIAVAVRPVSGRNEQFKGDGNLGLILGGVEAEPKG